MNAFLDFDVPIDWTQLNGYKDIIEGIELNRQETAAPESSEPAAPESSESSESTTGRCFPAGRLSNELIKTMNNADSVSKDTFIQRIAEARGANTKQYTVTRERQEITINTPHGTIKFKNGFIDKISGKHSDNNIVPLAEMLLTRLFDTLIRIPQKGYFIVTTDELIESGLYKSADSVRVHFEKDYFCYLRDNVYIDFHRIIDGKTTIVKGVNIFGAIEHDRGAKDYRIYYDIQHVNDLRYIFCGEFVPLGDVWDKLDGDARRLYLYMLIQTRINATRISENLPKQDLTIKRSKTTAAVFCGFPLDFELKGNPNKNKQIKRFDKALRELKALQAAGKLEFIITDNNDSFSFEVSNQTESGLYLQDILCNITDSKKEKIKKKAKKSPRQ